MQEIDIKKYQKQMDLRRWSKLCRSREDEYKKITKEWDEALRRMMQMSHTELRVRFIII